MRVVRALFLGAFLVSIGVASCQVWMRSPGSGANTWAWLSMALALASTVAAETRDLPAQNVILASSVIGAAGAIGAISGQLTCVEVINQGYAMAGGQARFGPGLPATCEMWVVMILSARGVAKILLEPFRGTANYGVWMILTTAVLVMGLEVSALATNEHSAADRTHPVSLGVGNPWVHLTGWTAMTLLTLMVATPILINKSVIQRRASFEPMVVWLAVGVVLSANAALHAVWRVVGFVGGAALLILICAIRNWRWNSKTEAELEPQTE